MSDSTVTAATRSFRQRWLPHPLLTAILTGFWMLLLNDLSMGGLVVGVTLGILIPLYTTNFWPTPPRVKSWPAAAGYFFLVMWDIVVANVQVAYWILFWRNDQLQPKFFTVPLDIRVPEGIATLAGTITMTPGTVSSDLSADGKALLVHGLHVPDEAAIIATIKSRYEARLLEIFA
jgi:multicomponent K+:H+ antiporter subunit E